MVILNSNEYFKKLEEIILDQTKFVEVVPKRKSNIYPLISRETSIGKYIRKCLKKFKSQTVQKLIPSGSSPGKLYGLIKTHKTGNSARQIIGKR